MIVVAAKLKAVEGKGDELEQEFRKLVPKVLKDPGAIVYAVHRKADAPNEFLVYEKYENGEAFKFHGSTEHFKEFSKSIASLLDGRPDVALYKELT
ncbi:MAG: antibiotic biosynthesis monooxygenase [Dehalococcoidia bacterium]|nr:antibiotic biosynthesis monooxygenase [Dehalococcoidia bacterium]